MDTRAALEVLTAARTIAVLGAHPDLDRPAGYVPEYLHSVGYRVLPVNARYAGQTLWGEPVRASLAEIAQPVDIVDVFRRAEDVTGHLADILAMRPLPRCVWLQLGIVQPALVEPLAAAGIALVQDRCTLADHRRFRLPAIATMA